MKPEMTIRLHSKEDYTLEKSNENKGNQGEVIEKTEEDEVIGQDEVYDTKDQEMQCSDTNFQLGDLESADNQTLHDIEME